MMIFQKFHEIWKKLKNDDFSEISWKLKKIEKWWFFRKFIKIEKMMIFLKFDENWKNDDFSENSWKLIKIDKKDHFYICQIIRLISKKVDFAESLWRLNSGGKSIDYFPPEFEYIKNRKKIYWYFPPEFDNIPDCNGKMKKIDKNDENDEKGPFLWIWQIIRLFSKKVHFAESLWRLNSGGKSWIWVYTRL